MKTIMKKVLITLSAFSLISGCSAQVSTQATLDPVKLQATKTVFQSVIDKNTNSIITQNSIRILSNSTGIASSSEMINTSASKSEFTPQTFKDTEENIYSTENFKSDAVNMINSYDIIVKNKAGQQIGKLTVKSYPGPEMKKMMDDMLNLLAGAFGPSSSATSSSSSLPLTVSAETTPSSASAALMDMMKTIYPEKMSFVTEVNGKIDNDSEINYTQTVTMYTPFKDIKDMSSIKDLKGDIITKGNIKKTSGSNFEMDYTGNFVAKYPTDYFKNMGAQSGSRISEMSFTMDLNSKIIETVSGIKINYKVSYQMDGKDAAKYSQEVKDKLDSPNPAINAATVKGSVEDKDGNKVADVVKNAENKIVIKYADGTEYLLDKFLGISAL